MNKEKPAIIDPELISIQSEDLMEVGTANQAVSELLTKAVLRQDGQQQYFLLEGEEAEGMLSKLAGQAPQGFILTNEWVRPDTFPGLMIDESLRKIGAHLQSVAKPSEPASVDDIHCECGDEVYVLPDQKAMQELIANLGASDAADYTKMKFWNKNQADADNKQLALLGDIAARLQVIETILLRLEQLLKPGGAG